MRDTNTVTVHFDDDLWALREQPAAAAPLTREAARRARTRRTSAELRRESEAVQAQSIQVLRRSLERRRRIAAAGFGGDLDSVSEAVFSLNPDWSLRAVSGDRQLTEAPGECASWVEAYVHGDDRAHVEAAIHKAIACRGVLELEHRLRATNGAARWGYSRALPLFDAQGEITEWLCATSADTSAGEAPSTLSSTPAVG